MMFPLSSPNSVCSPGLWLSHDRQSSNSRALEEFSIVICLFSACSNLLFKVDDQNHCTACKKKSVSMNLIKSLLLFSHLASSAASLR